MGVWGWIVLYVLLFSLLQLLIYRYLRSDEDAPLFHSTPPNGDPSPMEEFGDLDDRQPGDDRQHAEDPRRNDSRRNDDPTVVVCPRCGAENETGYTYCRNCVSPMTAR